MDLVDQPRIECRAQQTRPGFQQDMCQLAACQFLQNFGETNLRVPRCFQNFQSQLPQVTAAVLFATCADTDQDRPLIPAGHQLRLFVQRLAGGIQHNAERCSWSRRASRSPTTT